MAKQPRQGYGRLSRNDLLLHEVIDRLGHIAYGLRVYKDVPEPIARPGVVKKRKRLTPAMCAYLLKLSESGGATPEPMTPL